MKARGGLARRWMAVLALALVVWPGVEPRANADLDRDGSAGRAERVNAVDGAPESGHGLSSEGAALNVDLPPGTGAGWWATVQEGIRQSEYGVTWQQGTYLADLPAAYQAPNRAHNLRAYFASDGIRVIPRAFDGETPPWEWDVSLTGYGYAGALQPVGAATLHGEGNRIEYRRDTLTEWYVNDERGLEQGFTLHAPPEPAREGEVVLELALRGDLSPQLTADGSAVEFITAGGVRVLHYGELSVVDASGHSLPAHLKLGHGTIRILFDAVSARYPVTVDRLATTPAWTAESNQADARFGGSVGTAGDVNADGYSDVIVGAPAYDNGEIDEGRAYLYLGSATGLSSSPAWTDEGNQQRAAFGGSVATAGDVNGDGYADVIVGAPGYGNGEVYEGCVYVYHGGAGGLHADPDWTAEGNQSYVDLGSSVGAAGDVNGDGYGDVIVGAKYDGTYENEGQALIYHGGAAGLDTNPAWTAEGGQAWALFGWSVGTAGDVNGDGYADVIVGAQWYEGGSSDEGRAYVYLGGASGVALSPAWVAEGNQDGAEFGYSVGTAGDVDGDGYSDVIVGAPGYNGYTGRTFVYHGGAGGLGASPVWAVNGTAVGAGFGGSVATAGDVNGDGYSDAIVGAGGYQDGETLEGQASVYLGGAGGLGATPDWTAEGNQSYACFGCRVRTAGDVNGDGYSDVIVGALGYSNGETGEGRAYVYHGGAGRLGTAPAWTAEGNQSDARFGTSLGTAGDVNGDGYGDVIVGAPRYDNGQADEGRAYVYHGSAGGLGASPAWTAESNQEGAQFGSAVATAGDVNGDGYSDVIVGAPYYDGGQTNEGQVCVYHGSAGGLSSSPAWAVEGNQVEPAFGTAVGTAGDVNGDGYSDVIVGAQLYDNGQTNEGRAYVYHGGMGGPGLSPAWTAESNQIGAYFGRSVGTAGDVNGDGYSDVVVGAPEYEDGERNEGRAYVYHGGEGGLSGSPDWTAESNQAEAYSGYAVGTAGDVNGDGYSDVIVGAPRYETQGRADVYVGSEQGLLNSPAWTAQCDQQGALFGNKVGTAGDVNGDGYSDVIVGAPYYDNGETNEGRAFVYHGRAAGLGAAPAWTAESNQADAYFGTPVATAGDVNGDGYSDVIVGARTYDNGQSEEGRAYVYYGNGGDGLHMLPRQLRSAGSVPIARLGMTDSATTFRLSLIGRMPLGRAGVKLQWQVAPLGAAFGDPSAVGGVGLAWVDTGAGGVPISQIVTGLEPGIPYCWRVRLLYRPGNALGQAASRWIHIPWAGSRETDLRTPASGMRVYLPFVVR